MIGLPSLSLSLLIIAITLNVLISLLVFKNNPKGDTNRILASLGVIISVWLAVIYISFQSLSPEQNLFWIRLSICLATPMSMLFFLLAHTIPNEKIMLSKRKLQSLFALTALIMLDTVSPFAFSKVDLINNEPTPTPGIGLFPFSIFIIGCSFLSVVILFIRFKRSTEIEKKQIRLIMLGILLMYGLMIFTVLIPVAFFKFNKFVMFAPLYTLFFLVFTAYAIVKHRLLNIRKVVARAVSFTLITVFFGFLYAFIYSILTVIFSGSQLALRVVMISTFLALVMAFSFPTIQKVLERLTDNIFFKNKYNSDQLLFTLTKTMATTMHLEDLTKQTLHELLETMHITSGAFLVFDENGTSRQITEGNTKLRTYTAEILQILSSGNRILIYEDEEDPNIRSVMKELEVMSVLPLYVGNICEGLLLLWEKKSGEIYDEQDLKLLGIFGPEVSVALQNSKAYEQIKKFNITLTQEIKKATQDLEAANEKLKELDKLKDDFVSIASHELRTPMTAIRSYAWMALNRADIPLSEKMKKYLGRTIISTERLINLVNEMLNISRIESGRVDISPVAFDIQKFAEDVISEVSIKAQERHIETGVVHSDTPQVFADPDKVHQVLLNLVGNAVKFVPENGKISISFFSDGKMVEVLVKDNGVGIALEDKAKLFQKFGRLQSSYATAGTTGGTGLGLYICKSLIEKMGGKIWVISEGVNMGTTFVFSLPVAGKDILSHPERYHRAVIGEAKGLEPVAI